MTTIDLKNAWSEFINHKRIPEPNIVRPIILESWVRCVQNGVKPYQKKVDVKLSGIEFERIVKKNENLIRYSMPYLDNLYQFVKDSRFIISLASAEGVILKIIGEEEIVNNVRNGNYTEGADWSEKSAGTNGIGTALYIKAPTQIFSYEHFCLCSQKSTCSTAPIRDWQYNVIGAVTLTGADDKVNSHTLGMVVSVANAIENCLTMIRAEEDCKTANEYKSAVINSISQGILAADNEGKITHLNDIARDHLGLTNRSWIGIDIFNILAEGNDQIYHIIRSKEYVTDVEVGINTGYGVKKFNVTSRPINSEIGVSRGILLVIDEIKRAKKLVQKMSGAVASMSFDDLIGNNKKFLASIETAKHAAHSDSVVLLLGESGTGKDIIAQSIHNYSNRAHGPFLAINCGAIPKELIGSELFGYTEGAFTGARKGGNIGKFELADGGTLFLDEIGDMPLDMQTNLLRVLEEKRITRIGGSDIVPVNVRIIAATNKNLLEEVKNGRVRQDLYYRLNVITIHIAPLRDRMDDIPILVETFYKKMVQSFEKTYYPVPDDYIQALSQYNFAGNVRELQNIVERSVNLSKDGELSVSCLPGDLLSNIAASAEGEREQPKYPAPSEAFETIEAFEKKRIFALMKKYNGNVSKVSYELNMARSTLYRKLNKYGIMKYIEMS